MPELPPTIRAINTGRFIDIGGDIAQARQKNDRAVSGINPDVINNYDDQRQARPRDRESLACIDVDTRQSGRCEANQQCRNRHKNDQRVRGKSAYPCHLLCSFGLDIGVVEHE